MFTALDINTDEAIFIKPIAIKPSGSWDTLLFADAKTGKSIWRNNDCRWYIDLDGDLDDAETVKGIYGKTVGEWEAAANRKLVEYGFKLGDFDEEAGDRWELVYADISADDYAYIRFTVA